MRCVPQGWMQGAARSQWLFHWQGSQRRGRRPNAQPKGPEALLAHREAERPIKCIKTAGIFVTALRQKRFRRTRDDGPTGC